MSIKDLGGPQKSLSLKRFNVIMLATALLISVILFFAMRQTSLMYDKTHIITQETKNYETTAYNLQSASDYLTEQIRLFAITGEKKYLDKYFEESKITKHRDEALEFLKVHHGNSPAYAELQAAMNGSRVLMVMEYHAARLAVDAYGHNLSDCPKEIQIVRLSDDEMALAPRQKGEIAQKMLFSDEYKRQKTFIFDHIRNCLTQLEKEIWEEQNEISDNLKQTLFIEHLLTVLLIAILLGIVYLTSRLVIFPLRDYVALIRKAEPLPEKGAEEIRFLAQTYNALREAHLRHREQLNYEATHDKLTTLYNRRGFEFLVNELDLTNAAILLVDLDKFKTVNDIYGHDIGDKVLVKVAKALGVHFGDSGHICRLGGDEFVVILENTTPAVQEQLKKEIDAINQWLRTAHDGLPPISVSVGVTFCEKDVDIRALLKRADKSLYDAKEHGRSGVRFDTAKEK